VFVAVIYCVDSGEKNVKNPIRWITVSLALLFLFANPSCKNSTTDPPPKSNGGKRNYTWTVDTIAYPGSIQTWMHAMYVISPTNIYIAGDNGIPASGTMYHYDGTTWSTTRFHSQEGGPIGGGVGFSAIGGTGANDIYFAGYRGFRNPNPPPEFVDQPLLIHFNGYFWSEIPLSTRLGALQAFSRLSGEKMFAGGVEGQAYSNTNGQWNYDSTDSRYYFTAFAEYQSEVYATAYTPRPGEWEIRYFLKWTNPGWAIVDSFTASLNPPLFGAYGLAVIGDQLYSAGVGVFRRSGETWVTELRPYENLRKIYGTRREHIFAVGYPKALYHYNGSDWAKLEIPSNDPYLDLYSVWCNEEEVFILGSDGAKSYVFHGR
jgi:hypothetical protein